MLLGWRVTLVRRTSVLKRKNASEDTTMTSDSHKALREHLLYLLRGGGAHLQFDNAVADIPPDSRGRTVPPVPHSPWRLLEHMRIAQWDILESRGRSRRARLSNSPGTRTFIVHGCSDGALNGISISTRPEVPKMVTR